MLNNRTVISQDEKLIGKCTRAPYLPIVVSKAKGSIVVDVEGNKFIDMISSACVMNTGYNHPKILSKVKDQMNRYVHFANDYFYSEPQIYLAKELVEITPGQFDKKVIYGFTGSDAIDTAIKLSRAYTGRSKIISFVGAYHGSTYGAISLSAIDLNMKRKIGPLLPDIYHLPYPNLRYKPNNKTEEEFSVRKFNEFLEHFKYYIPKDETAAVFIEPIAGDLGLIAAPKKFIELLHEFCKESGILLVADEIQQGFGRTGKWFSIEHFNVIPDLVVMGKAMGSGFPMSAVVGKAEIIDSIEMPGQLFTLQGSAVSAIAALTTIEIIKEENLLTRATNLGELIVERFNLIAEECDIIEEVRGIGLTIGIELRDKTGKVDSSDIARKICYRAYEKGLIVIFLGGNTLRIQPPLNMESEIAETAMKIFEDVFSDYKLGLIPDSVLKNIKGW